MSSRRHPRPRRRCYSEIQINSSEMSYAKESPENARRILGDEVHDWLENTPGMPKGVIRLIG